MKREIRANQGGFIGTYILVGICLVLATGIVLYMINVRGETARREQAIAAADADSESSSDDASSGDTDTDTATTDGTSGTADTDTTQDTGGAGSVAETDELPQTGPADTAAIMVAMGVATYGATYHVQVRRQRATSLTSRGI